MARASVGCFIRRYYREKNERIIVDIVVSLNVRLSIVAHSEVNNLRPVMRTFHTVNV